MCREGVVPCVRSADLQRSVAPFKVITDMVPAGDQPRAIGEMERGGGDDAGLAAYHCRG